MTESPDRRRCRACGAWLAYDHAELLCSPCQSAGRGGLPEPPDVPQDFWRHPQVEAALATRHMGRVILAYRRHPHHGRHALAQEEVGGWAGMTQGQISRLERGAPPRDLDRLIDWALLLRIPQEYLWFDLPAETLGGHGGRRAGAARAAGSSADRRLHRSGAFFTPIGDVGEHRPNGQAPGDVGAPTARSFAVTWDELQHVAAALDEARYLDESVVDHFRRQIVACAAHDGQAGPRHALPRVLGIVAAVEQHARNVTATVRHDLLVVGARAAEFAGWLYRDGGDATLAAHWHDRAFEWAAEAGDLPMCGYVLLKKSQSAWDRRDAGRMLSLAQAAQQPTWCIPRRVHAEAAQQEARGHAMLGEPTAVVDRKLDEAHAALTSVEDEPNDPDDFLPLGTHYTAALLIMQTAICHSEAGEPFRAVELYRGWLSENHFSRRDYGYFLSLMATSLATADEVQEAARTGLRAHRLATDTNSTRTLSELKQLAARLSPWSELPDVRDLREAVLIE